MNGPLFFAFNLLDLFLPLDVELDLLLDWILSFCNFGYLVTKDTVLELMRLLMLLSFLINLLEEPVLVDNVKLVIELVPPEVMVC
jgi:hypothetical protein